MKDKDKEWVFAVFILVMSVTGFFYWLSYSVIYRNKIAMENCVNECLADRHESSYLYETHVYCEGSCLLEKENHFKDFIRTYSHE